MKNTKIVLVLLALLGSTLAKAQTAFCTLSHKAVDQHQVISFSVPRETNVYQYRVLGGRDSAHLELLTAIKPKGNQVNPQNYKVDLYEHSYVYFQVVVIGLDQKYRYSPVICTKEETIKRPLIPATHSEYLGCPVVKN